MKKICMFACLLFSFMFFSLTGCSNVGDNSSTNEECASFKVTFNGDGGTLTSGKEEQKICNCEDIEAPTYSKSGFTFNGWDVDLTKIKKDTTVKAKWNAINYTITYHLDDGVNGDNPVSYTILNSDITLQDASKAGFTFNGWYTESTFENKITKIDVSEMKNYEVFAKFTINQYTIAFNSNGGTLVPSIVQEYNSVVIEPEEPTKEGYTFSGWYTDNGTFINKYEFTTMPVEGVILYAKFVGNQYTITFNSNGGTLVPSIVQEYNSVVIEPEEPTKGGYTFSGWYTDNGTFINKYEFTTMPLNGIELYAKWSMGIYTISYYLDNGINGDNPLNYTVADSDIILEDASKVGFTFSGWYTEPTFENRITIIDVSELKNYNLYAKFTINQYTIAFNSNGGTNVESIVQNYNSVVTEPEEPTKSGYVFSGWYTDDETFIDLYEFTTMPLNGVELHAKWSVAIYTISYYLDNGINGDNPLTYTILDSDITLEDANKVGFTFSGWYTEPTFKNKITTIDISELKNYNVYAKFTINQYTIAFNSNGGTAVEPIVQNYNTVVTEPEEPTKDGYTFDGWYTDNGTFVNKYEFTTMPVEGVMLYAKFIANEYAITFNSNGGTEVSSIIQDYDTVIVEPEEPTKSGYLFDGWYIDNDTFVNLYEFTRMPLNGIELHAKWIKIYTITYHLDGGGNGNNPSNYMEADSDVILKDASKEGYTFNGWYTESTFENKITIIDVSELKDYEVYAKFTINQYAIAFNSNGGTTIEPILQDYNTVVRAPQNPTKEGCTFRGWYTDNDTFLNKYTFTTMPSSNIVLHAKYTPNQYTITFDSNGGTAVKEIKQYYGSAINEPTAPTYDGYDFDGWYTDDGTFLNKFEFTTMPANGATLHAKWNAIFVFEMDYYNTITGLTDYGKTLSHIVIPKKVGLNYVELIGERAFDGFQGTSIEFLYYDYNDDVNTRLEIAEDAFINCDNLESVYYYVDYGIYTADEHLKYWHDNLEFANEYSNPMYYAKHFYFKNVVDQWQEITKINLYSVLSNTVYPYSFVGFENVTDIYIKKSFKSIGEYAFKNTSANISFESGSLVTTIAEGAFFGNQGESITIPKSVTSLGAYAFKNSSAVIIFEEGSTITTIGDYAFSGYQGKTITIPKTVTSLGRGVFKNTSATITFEEGSTIATIGDYAFSGYQGESITVPKTVTSLGDNSFENISADILFENGNAIATIGDYAFSGYQGEAITIPKTVTSLGRGVFKDTSSTITFEEGSTITTIGDYAFSGYQGESITVPKTVTSLGEYAFKDTTATIIFEEGASITLLEPYSFAYYGGEKITIPDSITYIGISAFEGCENLENVYYDSTIANWLKISFPSFMSEDEMYSNPMYYAEHFFVKNKDGDWEELKKIELDESVTTIKDRAFYGFSNITEIVLPSTLKTVKNNAFADCKSLGNVYYNSTLEDWNKIAFSSSTSIPNYSAATSNPMYYAKHFFIKNGNDEWEEVTEITLSNETTQINSSTFVGFENVSEIIIPNTVTTIGEYAFYNFAGKITFEEGSTINQLTNRSFAGYKGEYLVIPSSVIKLEGSVFYNCSADVIFSKDALEYGYILQNNFASYLGESLVIPSNVFAISSRSFIDSINLKNIYFLGTKEQMDSINVSSGGNQTFTNATKYYYVENSEDVPNDGEKYWHFDTDGITPVEWDIY